MFVFVKQDTWGLISPFRGEWYINLSLPGFKVDAMPPKTAGHHKYNHKWLTGEEACTVNNVQQNGVLFRPFEHSVLLTTPPWPLWRDSSYRVNGPSLLSPGFQLHWQWSLISRIQMQGFGLNNENSRNPMLKNSVMTLGERAVWDKSKQPCSS